VLRGILAQALAAYPSRRSERLASLQHPLAGWLARRAQRAAQSIVPLSSVRRTKVGALRALGLSKVADDPDAPAIEFRTAPLSEPAPASETGSGARSHTPDIASHPDDQRSEGASSLCAIETSSRPASSVPPDVTAAARAPGSPAPPARRGLWFGLGGVALISVASVVIIAARSFPNADSRPPAATAPTVSAVAAPPALASVPALPSSAPEKPPEIMHRVASETTSACAERHLPDASVETRLDVEFLCSTHDPRKGDHLLKAALASAASSEAPAVRMWSSLSWYALPGYAALRSACCPDAPPIELPLPGEGCSALGPLLDEFAKAAVTSGDVDHELEQFHAAVLCEIDQRRAAVYWRKERPGGAEPTTLRGLLTTIVRPRPPH
jgi:hypothetical protein